VNFDQYIPLALRTAKPLDGIYLNLRHAVLGLITEIGEFTSEVKRIEIYDKPMSEEMRLHMLEELGDVSWYLAVAIKALGFTVQPIPVIDHRQTTLADAAMTLTSRVNEIITAAILRDGAYQSTYFASCVYQMVSVIDGACELLGSTGDRVRAENIAKLQKRFPDKFTNEAAEARADKGGASHLVS